MPYCPKCDMEFVDGITTCSDCGGPLMDIQEAAELLKAEKSRKEEEALQMRLKELGINPEAKKRAETDIEGEDDVAEEDNFPEEAAGEVDLLAGSRPQKNGASKSDTRAYITKRQHYEDTRSSQSAFLLLGGIFFAFGLLCFAGIITLPLDQGPMILFQTVLTALGLAGLVVAAVSKKSTARLIKEADAEDAKTKELVSWFTSHYTASALDELLFKEDPSLEENDLYLKRFELIQDHLVTGHDLPNQSYVDYLCEEIYKRIFEES